MADIENLVKRIENLPANFDKDKVFYRDMYCQMDWDDYNIGTIAELKQLAREWEEMKCQKQQTV